MAAVDKPPMSNVLQNSPNWTITNLDEQSTFLEEEEMEAPKSANDLNLKNPTRRGDQRCRVVAEGFSPSGRQAIVRVSRYREGLRIEQEDPPKRALDLHYSLVNSIQFTGNDTYTENRSVIGRAIVGKFVAGETGAVVGALSGLQKDSTTSTWFSITYWDVRTESWKQQLLEAIENGVTFMECAAEDLQAFRDGVDPDKLHDPTRVDRIAKKIVGYGIAGTIAAVVLYNVLGPILTGILKSTPTVSSASEAHIELTADQQRVLKSLGQSTPSPASASSAETIATNNASAASSRAEAIDLMQQASKARTVSPDAGAGAGAGAGAVVQKIPDGVETQRPVSTTKIDEPTGPSFNCAKASTAAEKRICANPELAALDRDLNDLYLAARTSTNETDLRMEQLAWLKTRSECLSDFCLKTAYEKRIRQLRRQE